MKKPRIKEHPKAPGPNPWEVNGKLPHEEGIKASVVAVGNSLMLQKLYETEIEIGEQNANKLIDVMVQLNKADNLLKEVWQYMEQQGYILGSKGSHGLKGKIGEYLIKYNIQ